MRKMLSKRRLIATHDEIDRKSKLLHAVNGVAELLLTADEDEFESALRDAMELVARCLDIDRVHIWRNIVENGELRYILHSAWEGDYKPQGETVHTMSGFSYAESIPQWEEKFHKGECVNGPLGGLSQTEQTRLGPYGIQSILVIPVHLRGTLWGFVSLDDCHQERTFTEDEVSILRSGNLMMVSAMDRREAAARMREADEHTKLMLDATPLCCRLWDRNHNIIDCNEEAVKLFKLKNKKEYKERFFELSPEYQPDGRLSREKAYDMIHKAFKEGRAVSMWMHQLLDGTPIPAESTLVRVRRGDDYIIAGYTRDLREHKKMMESIEHKDLLLRTVNKAAAILLSSEVDEFENDLQRCMRMLALSVGADRVYIWKNHSNEGQLYSTQLYEWSEGAEAQQGGVYTVNIPYNKISNWESKLSGGQCINGIVRLLSAEEQACLCPQGILSILVVPVFLHDKFWGFIGFDDCHRERVFSNVEESILRSGSLIIANALLRNEMNQKIHVAVEQALAASKAKSSFLAHMSHEIRTPMNVIVGMTELMLRENLPASIYEHVLSVKQASANMLSLINDILDFSKIEAGNLIIAASEYSLSSLINNVLMISRMKISEKPVLFTANIDCEIPNMLIGDEMRLRQILLNVLDNAAKYTAEGFISLTVDGEVIDDTVVLTAEVSDSGVGIKIKDIDTLFDDFMRFDNEKNRGIQGTGLGLAITKRLCQAMGGNISVRSKYGEGSTFTITIPQKIKSHSEKFAHVSNPEEKRVLLYETRSIYADSIVRSLRNLGVHCTLVRNQRAFFEEMRRGGYSFVFVSSLLYEGAEQAVEASIADAKLVLLTGFGETRIVHNARTIAMPMHAASIANILEDIEDNVFYNDKLKTARFIAPTAEVLVVDDLNTNLKVAQGLMLPYQMKVDVCGSGAEALELVQRKRYDIILMDHMMPGMDGIETTVSIRALEDENGYYQNLPIIALTANATSGAKEMFIENGMNDFLAKPIDVAKLYGLLEKWVPAAKKIKSMGHKPSAGQAVDNETAQFHIDGVDVGAGISMMGGTVEEYMKILAIFRADGIDKADKIRTCVKENDYQAYTIYVHAMKSATANIGAREVSELFRSLEEAGAQEDAAFIRENTGNVLAKLEILMENIRAIFPSEAVSEGETTLPRNELMALKVALYGRDAGEIDDMMSILETNKWDERAGTLYKEISRNILMINYADAVVLIDKLLAE